MDKNIYIQKGVKKIYNDDKDNVLYVTEFDMDITNRKGYCIDSRYVDCFFYGYRENDGYRMSLCNNDIVSDRKISIDELDRGYIRLDEFIMNGEFIGREFRRLFPVITYCGDNNKLVDNRYLGINDYNGKYIVLYSKDNVFFVKYMYGKNELYDVVDCRYIQDGNYEFYGYVYKEYMDREKVYLDIVKQIDGYCKKKVKVRQRDMFLKIYFFLYCLDCEHMSRNILTKTNICDNIVD